MKTTKLSYPIYNLSNTHFGNAEIIIKNNTNLKGQFVQFKVVEDKIEFIYPSEKLCFLPAENKNEFWNSYNLNKGEFKTMPGYILQLSLSDIKKIIIEPALVS